MSKSEVMDQLAEYNQDYYSPSWGGRFWGGGYNEGPIWDDFNVSWIYFFFNFEFCFFISKIIFYIQNGGAVLLTNAIEPERSEYSCFIFFCKLNG